MPEFQKFRVCRNWNITNVRNVNGLAIAYHDIFIPLERYWRGHRAQVRSQVECCSIIHVLGAIRHWAWRNNKGAYHHDNHGAWVLNSRSGTILTEISTIIAVKIFMTKFFTNLAFGSFFYSLKNLTLLPLSLNLWSLRFSKNSSLRLGTKLVVLWSEEIFIAMWEGILVLWVVVRLS